MQVLEIGRTIGKFVGLVFRAISFPIRVLLKLRKPVLVLLMIGFMALNVATLATSFAFDLVSGALETVFDATTIRKRHKVQTESLAQENLRLKKTISEQDVRARELRRNIQGRDSRIRALEAEKANRLVEYRGQKRLAKNAVEDTATRISRRVAFATARNAASVFGEALPFIGVAVIVGATAWEINDACEMLKDVHELEVAFFSDKALNEDATVVCATEVPPIDEIWSAIANSPTKIWEATSEMYSNLPEVSISSSYEWAVSTGAGFVSWVTGENE